MKKRLISCLLAVALMLAMLPTAAFAAADFAFTVSADKTNVEKGDVINFTVKVNAANASAYGGFEFVLDISDGLTYISGSHDSSFEAAAGADAGYEYNEDEKFVLAAAENGLANLSNLTVLTFSCSVDNDATANEGVSLKEVVVTDVSFDPLDAAGFAVEGAEISVYIPCEHTNTEKTNAVEATCVKDGNIAYWTCECGKIFSDEACTTEITAAQTKIGKETVEHTPAAEYTTDAGKHWKACTVATCTAKLEEANCSGGTATCIAKAECAVCGVEYGAKDDTNHVGASTMDADDDYHWGKCACNAQLEKTAHTYEWIIDKEATVYEVGLKHEECSVCEYVRNENTEIEKVIPEMPTATVGTATSSSEMPLSVSAKFTADAPTAEQQYYYNNWYVDFVLTSNKDIDLTGKNYLAGEYGTYGWVKIEGDAVPTIKAGEPLKIVESGLGGMKMKYKEIWETVKEFQCGVYLAPEFLLANEDIELTLALNLYDREGKVYTIVEKTYEPASVALPEATVGEAEVSDEMPLSVSAKFTAVEPTAEQKAAYDNWYVDFVLTSNVDIDLSAGNYLAGEYGTYGWVKIDDEAIASITAGEAVKIVETGLGGMKMKYREIWETVKEFQCGVYLTPEFLLANEDIELTLALNLYNRQGKAYKLVEKTYIPEAIALPEATIGEAEVSEEMPLTISTKFTAVEPTAEQKAAYDNWYADFVLTANKDIPLTEGNYLAGEYGTYGWVKIDGEAIEGIVASEPLKIVETGLGGMKMKYREIWETVQEFQCGLFLTPEFLKANEDLEIELVLNLYDRSGNVYPIAVFEYLPEEAEEEDDGRERPDEEPTKPTKPSEPTKPSTPAEEETEDVIVVTQPKVDEAEEQQAPVRLDMTPVNPNSLFGGASTIKIQLPVNAGKVPVEVPVEDVTAGTVVVIVHEDGTEEVINNAVITENGIVVELEGNVTIKVVDKSLNFTDVHGVDHWAAKHIDFVTARGLFNGTSATTFSPEELTTRGQLMTVLARLSGDGAATIADGIDWAVKSGISDGSNPNGFITRQDVAVMMWRAAGNLVSAYDISGYTDSADVASYAQIAIAWAVENGILTGYPDGSLMPLANATRAHVATMMERMVNNIK